MEDVVGTCLAKYTLPEDRPPTWAYRLAIGSSLAVDCGIELTRYEAKE
jgi:hypothetical protein